MAPLPDISLVVPVFKEEGNIEPFLTRVVPILESIGSYEILFCLDPSPDRTQDRVEAAISRNPNIKLLLFSRRFGQPAATRAGLANSQGRAVAVIDVDLQDPPELIPQMFQLFTQGFDVIYGQRKTRAGETWLKRMVAYAGYKVINKISDVEIPRNTGDFRLMSRRVVDAVLSLREKNGFLRGLVSYVGFRQTFVTFDRDPRHVGKGNYNRYWGSILIGFNGIFGFSNRLLSFVLLFGLMVAVFSIVAILVMVGTKLYGIPYPIGIPTIICLVLFMGGVQLTAVGIVGEYIGRIYDEVKDRPLYLVDQLVTADTLKTRESARAPVAEKGIAT